MTSKQRAYLKKIASTEEPIFQIGKSTVTPEIVNAIDEALAARELIKLNVLKNCFEDPKEIAETIAGRTKSQVVQVIGRKIILYKKSETKTQIILP